MITVAQGIAHRHHDPTKPFETLVPMMTFLVMILVLIYTGWGYGSRFDSFRRDYKARLIIPLIHFLSPSLKYKAEGHVDAALVKKSGILGLVTWEAALQGEDSFEGKIDGLDLAFSEVTLSYLSEPDNKGHRNTLVHRGMFFTLDFNKNFKSRTLIQPDWIEGAMGGYARSLFAEGESALVKTVTKASPQDRKTRPLPGTGWGQEIRMEDLEFEKYFAVRAEDPVEARYILSPSLMRRIVEFREWAGCPMSFSFVDSRMNVFLEMGDALDIQRPDMAKSLLDFQTLANQLRIVILLENLARDLNQTTRIWGKR